MSEHRIKYKEIKVSVFIVYELSFEKNGNLEVLFGGFFLIRANYTGSH